MSAKITVKDNGSIKVEGNFELFDSKGNRFDLGGRDVISLCRCGASAKQPFCDGSHGKCGFSSEINAYALEPKK